MTDKKDERYDYVVYKLCSDFCSDFYIGSTRNMVQRKRLHKSSCNNPNNKEYNLKKNQIIRDKGGFENWRMVPLELMKNSTKFEAEIREEQLRVKLKPMLNSQKATCGGLTKQEYNKQYREEHIDHIRERDRQYHCDNRERILEYSKQYRINNKEYLSEQNKQYRKENIDHIKDYMKDYYQENKEKIKSQQSQKTDCECGSKINHGEKARHHRTKKHQNYVDSLELSR
jgi:hypothetical protein